MNKQIKVGVIGQGHIGSCVAQRCSENYDVYVWNRSEKLPLKGRKFEIKKAPSISHLVKNSDFILLTLTDFNAIKEVFENLRPNHSSKIFLNLSTSTRGEALEFQEYFLPWKNCDVLDGCFLSSGSQIKEGRGLILLSGQDSVYNSTKQLMEKLGRVIYCGNEIGAASALDCAVLTYSAMSKIGLMQAFSICQSAGVSQVNFNELMGDMLRAHTSSFETMIEKISSGQPLHTEEKLKVWRSASKTMLANSKEQKLDDSANRFLVDFLSEACEYGHSDREFISLYSYLRRLTPPE